MMAPMMLEMPTATPMVSEVRKPGAAQPCGLDDGAEKPSGVDDAAAVLRQKPQYQQTRALL